MKIKEVKAREILDSRGNPTVEVDVITQNGLFRCSVPSGASTGKHEAVELRDGGKRYHGKGVQRAVKNVNTLISSVLIGMDCRNQKEIDNRLIELDGTDNKSSLGANAILGVSMAVCKAGAISNGMRLFDYIAELSGNKKLKMPVPSFNILNGGKHAGNKLAIQEFMILPTGAKNFKEALQIGSEVYFNLKKIISEKYGVEASNVGDEGGFAPNINNHSEALELIKNAIKKSGYSTKVKIGIDVAASEFYQNEKYNLGFKDKKPNLKSGDEMISLYKDLISKYNVISIEDPFDQDDLKNWSKLTAYVGNKIQIVGDDLLVTNHKRIERAIIDKSCNALLLKINQIGTITEAIEAAKLAKSSGWKIMVSHRSGETEDDFIADLVVGLGCGEIKAGAPCRGERTSKYNQLLRIEELLGRVGYNGVL